MSEKIAIIGAGHLGVNLESLLNKKYRTVFWDKNPSSKVKIKSSVSEALVEAKAVLLCVPTLALKEIIKDLNAFLPKNAVVITFSKGLNHNSQTALEFLQVNLTNKQPVVYVGGPMLSAEISHDKKWWSLVCGLNKNAGNYVVKLFKPTITAEQTSDIAIGVLEGVIKNCYTLGVGMAIEMGWGCNVQGKLMSKAISEMNFIVSSLSKPKDRKVITEIMIADFLATSLSVDSKNRLAGQIIAKGKEVLSEGTVSISALIKRLGPITAKNLPLLVCIEKIVKNKKTAESLLKIL